MTGSLRPRATAAPVPTIVAAVVAALAIVASVVLSAAVAGPVAADVQERQPAPSQVTAVDADGSRVEAAVLTENLAPSSVTVTEAGTEVDARATTARATDRATEVVYVVDIDSRTVGTGVLAGFVGAIAAETADLPDSVKVGIVTAGAEANLVTRLTTSRTKPAAELRAVAADRGSALIDAVTLAADAFGETTGVVRTVVVLTAGVDTASLGAIEQAETALVQRGAQLVTIGVGSVPEGLAGLSGRTGGVTLTVPTVDGSPDDEALDDRVAIATEVAADRLLVSYPSEADAGTRPNVQISIDEESVAFSYPAGVLTTNVLQLAPNDAGPAQEPGLFGHPIVLYVSVALAFLAISGSLWVLGSMYAGGESSLDKVLARYSEQDTALDDAEVQEMLVQTALIQRAVAMTESFAERQGFLSRVEEMLERANVPIRAGEAMFFLSIGVVGAAAAGLMLTGSIFVAAIAGIVAAGLGYAGLQLAARRRLKAFEAQLPDTLQLLAGTLRAGYSLPQGIDAVSHEIDDPMGQELRRAMTEAQLGRELDDALANIAERLDSEDFAWAVMAIGIQREVGGNLAEVLLTVADTMIQRERLKREVNALTAEGRVSAGILSMLPPGLGFVMWVMNPTYVGVLFSRTIGLVLIGLAVVSGLIGLAWMKKVITIDA